MRSRARFLFHRRGEFYFVIPARAGIQSLFLFSFGFFAFRRRPPEFVIPAEAGIHLLLFLTLGGDARTDSRPCEFPSHPCEGVTFSCLCKRK